MCNFVIGIFCTIEGQGFLGVIDPTLWIRVYLMLGKPVEILYSYN